MDDEVARLSGFAALKEGLDEPAVGGGQVGFSFVFKTQAIGGRISLSWRVW